MPQHKVNINLMAPEDRPREKMAMKGAGALSDAELLAILIGSGSTDETAVQLMQRLLRDCNNSLKELGRKSLLELTGNGAQGQRRYKGLGQAKAITLLAACELGRRRAAEETLRRERIGTADDLWRYFGFMADLQHEECHALFMSQSSHVLGSMLVGKGGWTGSAVDVRQVMREALLRGAPLVALCHNHPSGNLRPSSQDDSLTRRLAEACHMMDIRLVDHLIVAGDGYYSYRNEGRI